MADFEGRIAELAAAVDRSCDLFEIRNTLNRYLFAFSGFDTAGVLSCFAMDAEDVTVEFGNGKYVGAEDVARFYRKREHFGRQVGAMIHHTALTQSIEIAADGKTARAAVASPGDRCNMETETQVWDMGRYYVEFLRTDAGWKIWHLQWIVVAEADIDCGPLMQSSTEPREVGFPVMSETLRWDARIRMSDQYVDYFQYDECFPALPEVPAPYETYDGYKVLHTTRGY